jgi:hypothetical protein
VVISVRDDNALGVVRTSDCYARMDLLMKIIHMHPKIGSLRLEQVDSAVHPPSQQPAYNGKENHSSPSLSFEKVRSFCKKCFFGGPFLAFPLLGARTRPNLRGYAGKARQRAIA